MFIGPRAPLETDYLYWLYRIVRATPGDSFEEYQKLLYRLQQTPYTPLNPFDANRAEDGIELRKYFEQYGDEFFRIPSAEFHTNAHEFYDRYSDAPCSMLEMMIALARKIDETMLPKFRCNRTFIWFWMMIEALELAEFTDWMFDEYDTDSPVDRILQLFNGGFFSGTLPAARIFDIHDDTYQWYGRDQWDIMQKWYHDYYAYLDGLTTDDFIKDFHWRRTS